MFAVTKRVLQNVVRSPVPRGNGFSACRTIQVSKSKCVEIVGINIRFQVNSCEFACPVQVRLNVEHDADSCENAKARVNPVAIVQWDVPEHNTSKDREACVQKSKCRRKKLRDKKPLSCRARIMFDRPQKLVKGCRLSTDITVPFGACISMTKVMPMLVFCETRKRTRKKTRKKKIIPQQHDSRVRCINGYLVARFVTGRCAPRVAGSDSGAFSPHQSPAEASSSGRGTCPA
jgi:hypothetical protein